MSSSCSYMQSIKHLNSKRKPIKYAVHMGMKNNEGKALWKIYNLELFIKPGIL